MTDRKFVSETRSNERPAITENPSPGSSITATNREAIARAESAAQELANEDDSESNWHRIVLGARLDPFLAALVALVRQGRSREEALLSTVLALAQARADLLEKAVERMWYGPVISEDIRGDVKRAVADTLRTLMGAAAAQPYINHLERAIDALDQPKE